MLLSKPEYFDRFRCIAGACPDSCCKEWDVQVDPDAAGVYRSLPGPLGDKLRQVLYEEEGETYMAIENGRCPMWRADGLCRIQAELGEEALCHVCRAFPRLTHDYGDFVELGLELSCPEAARLILTDPAAPLLTEGRPGGQPGYDQEAMAVLKAARDQVLAILSDKKWSIPQALTLALLFGYQAQDRLDGGKALPFSPEGALETAAELAEKGDMHDILDFFRDLEILTPQWQAMLAAPAPAPWQEGHLALARYLVNRYWLQAVSDYDLYSRVKFIITACLLVRHLGGDLLPTAQLFSKEIENNAQNVDALLDAAYAGAAFTDAKILGLLMA